MNEPARSLKSLTLSIAAAERDTGLTKDTLRVWERRYGFPRPDRDGGGERAYPLEQVEKLRVVKRLMDAGHRPGRLVSMPIEELVRLSESTGDAPRRSAGSGPLLDLKACLALMRSHDVDALRRQLLQTQMRMGLARFVIEVVMPLNTMVGDAWMRGQMEIFEEHAYIECLHGLLRQALAGLPEAAPLDRPRVLLTTLPGEPHGLGLLLAQALLALEGARVVSLGVQTPVWDISLAAAAHRSDIVALGFTGCMNPNQVVDGLSELRSKLPPAVELWVGGSAPVLHRRTVDGVMAFSSLEDIRPQIERWRHGSG
ncbi:MAG TPA: MerR family transcriptional regulator [Burkholderiaceae bacterium]|jgi:DNA-binding transcriptional MerR regulator/methylmalonyl-CoA mutase cobalamin-binding subunit|nr:MerR family transcriptional regulator [Burkholderiaceae bacterium]